MHNRAWTYAALVALSLTYTSFTATAQPPSGAPGAGGGPCADDIKRLCADVRGARNIAQCLKQHEADVSGACKEHQDRARTAGKTFMQACRGDVQTLCKDVKAGEGRMWNCVRAHENELSEQCKAFVKGH
jgi:hypothetical protein